MQKPAVPAWKILVVDDEPDVLTTTDHALMDVSVLGRPLALLTATSAVAAQRVLAEHRDVAVILLDVVMEKMQSGLTLVNQIRADMNNQSVRIILRTGNPGAAPEHDVVNNYAIDDYIHKGSVTRNRLITAVVTAVRAYDQLTRVSRLKAAMEALFDLSNRMTEVHDMAALGQLLSKSISKVLPGISSGAVAFTNADPHAGTSPGGDLLTFLPAKITPPEGQTASAEVPLPKTSILATYLGKASQHDEVDTLLYMSSDQRACVIWAQAKSRFDEIDQSVLQNLASLVNVNLERLNRIHQQSSDAMTALGIMVQEFRTPLAALALSHDSLTAMLGSNGTDNLHATRLLKGNAAALERMRLHIESSMTNLNAVTGQGELLAMETQDLGEIVSSAIERTRSLWAPTGELSVTVQPKCLVNLNRAVVEQIMVNLMSNSVKAVMARSSRASGPQISISVARAGGQVILSVADQGIGIKPELRDRIFAPFFSSGAPAHGLGLTMVQKSVHNMGGDVECISKIGHGTTFRVAMPAMAAQP